MRLAWLTVAGAVLSTAADSPFQPSAIKSNDSNDSALSCIQNIDYSPSCDTTSVTCWCKDTPFITQVNLCTIAACSEPVIATLARFQSQCALEQANIPQFDCIQATIESKSLASEGPRSYISRNTKTMSRISKRDPYTQIVPGFSRGAIAGVCFALFGILFVALLAISISKRRERTNSLGLRNITFPQYESRGTAHPRGNLRPRPLYPRATATPASPRSLTPPPPYIRAPVEAHVKDDFEGQGLPAYDDRSRGSNAV